MTNFMVKSGSITGPVGFALQIRQHPARARFPKSKSGTALVVTNNIETLLLNKPEMLFVQVTAE